MQHYYAQLVSVLMSRILVQNVFVSTSNVHRLPIHSSLDWKRRANLELLTQWIFSLSRSCRNFNDHLWCTSALKFESSVVTRKASLYGMSQGNIQVENIQAMEYLSYPNTINDQSKNAMMFQTCILGRPDREGQFRLTHRQTDSILSV